MKLVWKFVFLLLLTLNVCGTVSRFIFVYTTHMACVRSNVAVSLLLQAESNLSRNCIDLLPYTFDIYSHSMCFISKVFSFIFEYILTQRAKQTNRARITSRHHFKCSTFCAIWNTTIPCFSLFLFRVLFLSEFGNANICIKLRFVSHRAKNRLFCVLCVYHE